MKRDRKEITRLKRENLQLRRMLEKNEIAAVDRKEHIEEREADRREAKKQKTTSGLKCPKCNGAMELMDLGRIQYKICMNQAQCWHREKIK